MPELPTSVVSTVGKVAGGVVRLPPSVTLVGSIAVVKTGEVSTMVKVVVAVSESGGVAVVVVDDGVSSEVTTAVDVASVVGAGAADEGVQQDRYDTDRTTVPV